jgi:hypothetical protein
MVIRMSAGDLNAWIALIGFVCGVATGSLFLKNGFSLGRAYETKMVSGMVLPILMAGVFVLLTCTSLLIFSESGPGSKHAPVLLSLAAGLVVGALAQKSGMCFAGGLRDLFLMKDFGLTAVTTYVPWNLTEPKRGEYCFDGRANLMLFLELCQKCDLKVILRCSPYLCGEWEMGGLPSWLLKDRTICVRSSDPGYMEAANEYNKVLCEKIRPYLHTNGGPVILVGLENEYGSFGDDLEYLQALCDFYRNENIDVPFVSANGVDNFKYINELDKKGALVRSINFFTKETITIDKSKCSSEHIDFINSISFKKETFIEWFNKHYKDHIDGTSATLPIDELYETIKPYLTYICQDKWDFKVLLYYMLSVDIAIETDRIGMINYKFE